MRNPVKTFSLLAGKYAGPVFIATFSIEGLRRPQYRPRRHPVSSLELGPQGWVQVVNFVVTGTALLGGAVALASSTDETSTGRAGPFVIGTAAAGIVAAGVFLTDPVNGYPPGTPDVPESATVSGRLHDAFAVPTFLGLPSAMGIYAWGFARHGEPGWASYSAASAATMLAALGASINGFSQGRFVESAGAWQRVSIGAGLFWLTALFDRELRRRRRSDGD